MNNNQRYTLFTVAALVVLMGLFPPFAWSFGSNRDVNLGYSFILSPPSMQDTEGDSEYRINQNRGQVNGSRLLVQIAVVCVAGGAVCLALKEKP
jgi:hypothetical protein